MARCASGTGRSEQYARATSVDGAGGGASSTAMASSRGVTTTRGRGGGLERDADVAQRRAENWRQINRFFAKKAYLARTAPRKPQTTLTRTHPSLLGSRDDALGGISRRDVASSARGRVVRAPRRPSRRPARVSSVHERKKCPEGFLAPPRPDDARDGVSFHAHARARTEPRFHPRYPLQGRSRRAAGAFPRVERPSPSRPSLFILRTSSSSKASGSAEIFSPVGFRLTPARRAPRSRRKYPRRSPPPGSTSARSPRLRAPSTRRWVTSPSPSRTRCSRAPKLAAPRRNRKKKMRK